MKINIIFITFCMLSTCNADPFVPDNDTGNATHRLVRRGSPASSTSSEFTSTSSIESDCPIAVPVVPRNSLASVFSDSSGSMTPSPPPSYSTPSPFYVRRPLRQTFFQEQQERITRLEAIVAAQGNQIQHLRMAQRRESTDAFNQIPCSSNQAPWRRTLILEVERKRNEEIRKRFFNQVKEIYKKIQDHNKALSRAGEYRGIVHISGINLFFSNQPPEPLCFCDVRDSQKYHDQVHNRNEWCKNMISEYRENLLTLNGLSEEQNQYVKYSGIQIVDDVICNRCDAVYPEGHQWQGRQQLPLGGEYLFSNEECGI